MFRRTLVWMAVVVVAVLGTGAVAAAQQRQSLVIDSMVGADLFRFYCATCHGVDGKGFGPLAPVLRTPPADLTAIATRNAGLFPRGQVTNYVSSEDPGVVSHGSRTMPVWGPIFRALDASDVRTKMRIGNLVSYIESIQAR